MSKQQWILCSWIYVNTLDKKSEKVMLLLGEGGADIFLVWLLSQFKKMSSLPSR